MRYLTIFLTLILATFGVNAMDSRTALKQEVDARRQALNHTATIGRWRYEICMRSINRALAPIEELS